MERATKIVFSRERRRAVVASLVPKVGKEQKLLCREAANRPGLEGAGGGDEIKMNAPPPSSSNLATCSESGTRSKGPWSMEDMIQTSK